MVFTPLSLERGEFKTKPVYSAEPFGIACLVARGGRKRGNRQTDGSDAAPRCACAPRFKSSSFPKETETRTETNCSAPRAVVQSAKQFALAKSVAEGVHLLCAMALQVSLLILAAVCPALNTICDSYLFYDASFFDWQYSLLYSKLEEALINNQTILNILKHGFISTEDIRIKFSVHLEVENGTDLSSRCDNNSSSDTFCPKNSSKNVWELCADNGYSNSLTMSFISPAFDVSKLTMYDLVVWLSLLHGNFVTLLIQSMAKKNFKMLIYDEVDITLRLKIDTLKCNPPLPLTECALSELISWVGIILW